MTIAVLGLWHLGSVTAACLAHAGHAVVGWDPDAPTIAGLRNGRAPIAEPGLDEMIAAGAAAGRLHFTSSIADAVRDAEVVWIAFDTPVDEDDRADVDAVVGHVRAALPNVRAEALVICSSQLPVGTVARLEADWKSLTGGAGRIACVPENLRLGQAIDVFLRPDRVVAGVRDDETRARVAAVFAPVTTRIEWMSVESAEMTKHATNAFLGLSIAFANELATICEHVGADAKEVERGLKSDARIGGGAYLGPGAAFAGGTLARDLVLLDGLAAGLGATVPIISAVHRSNREHAGWAYRATGAVIGARRPATVAVWGLTYKPGTNTLRRSLSVELCERLAKDGIRVRAFDPAVPALPESLQQIIELASSAVAAASGADALVVATGWPEFRGVAADAIVEALAQPVVIDAGRVLAATLGSDSRVRYYAVGMPRS